MYQNGKPKLDDLPGNENEMWEGADIHPNLTPHTEISEDGHYFIRVKGKYAECKNCHWGFELDPGDEVRDGHLYDNTGKLVI